MIKRLLAAIFATAFGPILVVCVSSDQHSQPSERSQLWSAISVNRPLFQDGWTSDLILHFTLVNDGSKMVDALALIGNSTIVINGEELENSGFILGGGPRALDWNKLGPGGTVQFTKAMGSYFQKPGIYKVSWKSNAFETLPIEFRVLPRAQALPRTGETIR